MLTDAFLNAVNMSVTASYVIVAVIIVRFLLKKVPKKYSYFLWSAVGFRLIFPFSFDSVFSLFSFDLLNVSSKRSYEQSPLSYANAVTVNTEAGEYDLADRYDFQEREIAENAGIVNTENILAYVWLIVVCAFLVYGIASYIILRIKTANAVLREKNVYECDSVSSPFILGLVNPKIYIPFGLDGRTYDYVIEHEKCHLNRTDNYVKAFAYGLLSVYWFNPLCWLAFSLMSKDMEMSCDEKVLSKIEGIKQDYSHAILSFAISSKTVNVTPLCFSENSIKSRIKNVLKFKKPKTAVSIAVVCVCIIVIILCVLNPKIQQTADDESSQNIISESVQYYYDKDTFDEIFAEFEATGPQQSSAPGDYIDKNSDNYKFLIENSDTTIEYIYSDFLNGDQTGLKGQLMRIVMDDIIQGEAVKTYSETGQGYFDEFLRHNQRLLTENGDEFMKENYPYGYRLLIDNGNALESAKTGGLLPNEINRRICQLDSSLERADYIDKIEFSTNSKYLEKFGDNDIQIYKFQSLDNENLTFYIILSDDILRGSSYYYNGNEYAYNFSAQNSTFEVTDSQTTNTCDDMEKVKFKISKKDAVKIAENELKKDEYSEYVSSVGDFNAGLSYRFNFKFNRDYMFNYSNDYQFAYVAGGTINSNDSEYNLGTVVIDAETGEVVAVDFSNAYDN